MDVKSESLFVNKTKQEEMFKYLRGKRQSCSCLSSKLFYYKWPLYALDIR